MFLYFLWLKLIFIKWNIGWAFLIWRPTRRPIWARYENGEPLLAPWSVAEAPYPLYLCSYFPSRLHRSDSPLRSRRISLVDMVVFTVTRKETTPFDGQKPGTSGLRKKVRSRSIFPSFLLCRYGFGGCYRTVLRLACFYMHVLGLLFFLHDFFSF